MLPENYLFNCHVKDGRRCVGSTVTFLLHVENTECVTAWDRIISSESVLPTAHLCTPKMTLAVAEILLLLLLLFLFDSTPEQERRLKW